MVSGIYKIVNKINGKYYVGSSRNITGSRWPNHKSDLNKGIHFNNHLQSSWKKYGDKNFEFVIVEKISKNRLLIMEQQYLNIAKNEQDKCYNTTFIAGCGPGLKKGAVFSDEHKNNLSKSHMGQQSWNKGKTKETDPSVMRISKSKKGKIRNDIAKEYIFLDPNKDVIHIFNLKQFCKNNNLTYTTMNLLFYGKHGYKNHKGWTKYV